MMTHWKRSKNSKKYWNLKKKKYFSNGLNTVTSKVISVMPDLSEVASILNRWFWTLIIVKSPWNTFIKQVLQKGSQYFPIRSWLRNVNKRFEQICAMSFSPAHLPPQSLACLRYNNSKFRCFRSILMQDHTQDITLWLHFNVVQVVGPGSYLWCNILITF